MFHLFIYSYHFHFSLSHFTWNLQRPKLWYQPHRQTTSWTQTIDPSYRWTWGMIMNDFTYLQLGFASAAKSFKKSNPKMMFFLGWENSKPRSMIFNDFHPNSSAEQPLASTDSEPVPNLFAPPASPVGKLQEVPPGAQCCGGLLPKTLKRFPMDLGKSWAITDQSNRDIHLYIKENQTFGLNPQQTPDSRSLHSS